MIRGEAHRFAVTFHRKRRQIRDRASELREIPGVGESTTRRLLEHFGSLQAVKQADVAALSAVVTRPPAPAILEHLPSAERKNFATKKPLPTSSPPAAFNWSATATMRPPPS